MDDAVRSSSGGGTPAATLQNRDAWWSISGGARCERGESERC